MVSLNTPRWARTLLRYGVAIVVVIAIIAAGVFFDWEMDTLVGYPQ
jgi:hypothetical protein